MTVTNVTKDPQALTMTVTSELDAPIERAWQLWSDPRLLERWWGPPTYPATFLDHELSPGGRVSYVMTGPEGEKHGGWWRVVEVDAPHRLKFEDGFSDADGNPNDAMPITSNTVTLRPRPEGGTRMDVETTFPSLDALEQLISMGMEEGMLAAFGQIDEVLRTSGQPGSTVNT